MFVFCCHTLNPRATSWPWRRKHSWSLSVLLLNTYQQSAERVTSFACAGERLDTYQVELLLD